MKRGFLLYALPLAAIFSLALGVSAWAGQPSWGVDARKSPYSIYGTGMVFAKQETCSTCHGNGGKGSAEGSKLGVPDFTSPDWQSGKTDAQLVEHINAGSKSCPSYRGKMSPTMIKNMVIVVRNFATK
ncbi:MAG: c-type cytochrome [Candidatus Brocadiales bacterium]